MKRVFPVFIVFVMILSLLSGCGAEKEENEKLSIVTTIFPSYDFAKQIAGEYADVQLLLPPGTESHNFEPTAQQLIEIQDCDLFICNGGESDAWVDSLLGSVDGLHILKMMDCVSVMEEELVEGMETEEEDSSEAEYDEHVWTSPRNSIQICEAVRDAIKSLDESNTDAYDKNCSVYIEKLTALDEEFHQITDEAENKTVIFADRFPARYFVEEYGLEYYAAFPGCASDTEPSASTVAFIIDKVNELKIPAVFAIEFSNRKMADTVAESTGAEIIEFHSCHNVSQKDFENGVSYVDLMERNAEALKKALN